jgi:CO/xanthine dehydrogenase Mo-binding subunit
VTSADDLIRGRVRYAQDQELPGMLHGRIVRSPYPHARILRVDASAIPVGVHVLVPDDVAALLPYGCQIKDQTVLALDRARYAGDPIAAVAATTPEEADEALGLIELDYEELPAVVELEHALAADVLVHEHIPVSDNDAAYFGIRPSQGTNVCHTFRIRHGDASASLAEADVVVEQTFRTDGAQHVAMEPHAALARWVDGRLEVWTGTHTPFNVRQDLAGIFGLPEEQVRVVCPPMGGSFGAKTFVRVEAIAAALARKSGRPVRLVLPRAEEWLTNGRHPSLIHVQLGARADGTFVAKRVDASIDTGAYADCGPGVAVKIGYSAVGPYRIPNVHVDSRCVYTNLPPNGAFRGYGATQAVWASELLVDRLADELGIDPLELRLRNLLRDGDTFCTGETMRDVHFAECLERAAQAVGWSEGRRGKGLAVVLKGMQTPGRARVAVEADGDGGYTIRCATAEMGQGSRRAISLIAAELLGAELDRIRFPDPDTDIVPYDTRSTSSRSTHVMAHALEDAVRALHRNGARGEGEFRNEGGLDPDTGQGIASSHWHQGAAAAELSVDEETGEVEVLRLHAATYAGRVVNAPAAALQNEGSMIMGLGGALLESVSVADGQVVNANLSDYEIPSIADLPASFSHDLVEHAGAEVHGLGETAVPPVPAAIGNALGSLGIRLCELPITAEAVLGAIDERIRAQP